MTEKDFESLAETVEALRKSVKRNSPLLREVAASRVYGALSLPLGAFIMVFSIGTHFLLAEVGNYEALPRTWKALLWAFMGFMAIVASIVKIRFIGKKAKSIVQSASIYTVLKALYSGIWAHLNLLSAIAFVAVAAFAVVSGKPWYLVPTTALFLAVGSNTFGILVERPEYFATGWYALVAGILSLFFIESAPWLWLAAVFGGALTLFGLVNLFARESSRPSRDETRAEGAEGGSR